MDLPWWIELKKPPCLKKHNHTYGQIDRNELCKVNLLFFMYVKRIVIIITYAATNRGWCFFEHT